MKKYGIIIISILYIIFLTRCYNGLTKPEPDIPTTYQETEKEYSNIDYKTYIQLLSATAKPPNSAGGIDLCIVWKNVSDKTVKYADFTCALYNAVDDMVQDTITHRFYFKGRVTGPVQPNEIYGKNYFWENAWWNNSGKYVKITGIQLEYMDGTKIEIPDSHIDELFY